MTMLPQLYHAHHSLHCEDLPFWLELARRAGDPVLELGCGTGRVLLPLAQAGLRVFGLDRELAWLQFLRRQQPGMGSISQGSAVPHVFVGDLCAFHLAQRFPLILLPCNTLSTLHPEARRAMLRCVQRHLLPGGLFAASLPNPELLRRLPCQGEGEVEDTFFHPESGLPVQVSSAWQRTRREFLLTWHYDLLHPDGGVERFTIQTWHSLAPAEEYERDMQSAGLRLIETYGDYDKSPAGPYWIVVAEAG